MKARPVFLLRVLLVLGLLVNLVIVVTGLRPTQAKTPKVDLVALEQQLVNLTRALEGRDLPAEQQAEEKALALFALAEKKQVKVVTWSSKAVIEPLGKASQVNLMRSAVEMRGEREKLIAIIVDLKQVFGENVLVSNVEMRGAGENWVLRVILSQMLAVS